MRFAALSLFLLVVACSGGEPVVSRTQPAPATNPVESPERPSPTPPPPMPGVTLQQLLNAEYELGAADDPRTVQLTNGTFREGQSGSEFLSVSLSDFIALGDLDGDGINEAAALVTENYGGTGSFVFLALYVELDDRPVFRSSIFLGDRPQVNGIAIDNGEIYIDATIHTADDPLCCPTQPSTRHYRVIENRLVLSDFRTQTPSGRLRTIEIESPLDGTVVTGIVQIRGNVSVAPFENNLVYRIYDLGGVELVAGAIPVAAADLGGPGTFDRAIDVAPIPAGTSIRLVIQDINMADGSLFAMDSVLVIVR